MYPLYLMRRRVIADIVAPGTSIQTILAFNTSLPTVILKVALLLMDA